MRTLPELRETVIRMDTERKATLGQAIGTDRVDLRHIEQMRFEARSSGFTLTIDEPRSRGGTKMGLHPLGHFLLGGASCFLTQFARLAISKEFKIDGLELTARAHFDIGKTRAYTDIIYDVRLTGSENEKNLLELLHLAEETCFVHQTLKKAIPLTTNLSMNGKHVTSHTIGPEQP